MAQHYVYSGKTRISNIPGYIAQELRLPSAAIEIKFKWVNPKTGEVKTLEGADLARPLSELRLVWDE